ncbi:Hypothetical predicted protein [Podarcis lilfordi]|uniref:Uncharacterized protein n=1 Tax=Podarcis lilfordi TaxID=74358 RepID=A0AA35K6G1_9SAUR|nr:Hypothetical predicted protein [Podarcis lilfordi]
MSPKRVPAQPALTVPPKRTIQGPSQLLRSPSTGQASGCLQSLVSSLAGDPAALARFASEVDSLIQRCSAGPSQQPAVTTAAAVSSLSDSASSDENDLPMSGVLFSDSQFSRNAGSAPAFTRGRAEPLLGAQPGGGDGERPLLGVGGLLGQGQLCNPYLVPPWVLISHLPPLLSLSQALHFRVQHQSLLRRTAYLCQPSPLRAAHAAARSLPESVRREGRGTPPLHRQVWRLFAFGWWATALSTGPASERGSLDLDPVLACLITCRCPG